MSTANKTVVLITGANQGIGLATATALAKDHGYHVIIGSRSLPAGQKVASDLKTQGFSADAVQLDLQSDGSIAAAAAYITDKYGHLDVLINNAGVLLDATFDRSLPLRELYQKTFSVNVFGTAALTEALLPLLRKSEQIARVVFLSSRMGSLAESLDPTKLWYHGNYIAYDASKAAVNLLAIEYSRVLNTVEKEKGGKGAYVNVVCPGLIKTNLTGYIEYGDTTENGAIRAVELATLTGSGPETKTTGTFSARGEVVAW
jgi:NAD(P)-dependent dehydrogenase (short-subunit alcohol dehydrogenase family)